VFDGIRDPDNADIKYYYPTNDLVTAPEIIFFWVARMIMAGQEYRKGIPFKNVYFTGIVRDKQGRKMSKSLGNSPEPLELIGQFGADAVRMGMLLCSPAGNDLLYDESLIEQGRNFCNKIWNAMRLVKGWEVDPSLPQPDHSAVSVKWFESVFNSAVQNFTTLYTDYRLSEALMAIYKMVWDDFCSWYLEMVKPAYQQPIDKATMDATVRFFNNILLELHPYLPFITEEIWHILGERGDHESIMVTRVPEPEPFDEGLLNRFAFAEEVVIALRNLRKDKDIPAKESIRLMVRKNLDAPPDTTFDSVVMKLCGISELTYVTEKVADAASVIVRATEFYVPVKQQVNKAEEIRKLNDELAYYRGFLATVDLKLNNEKFMAGAPVKVVESERKKQSDSMARIRVLEELLKSLTS
jgi:valyl-tRNA synthetase